MSTMVGGDDHLKCIRPLNSLVKMPVARNIPKKLTEKKLEADLEVKTLRNILEMGALPQMKCVNYLKNVKTEHWLLNW